MKILKDADLLFFGINSCLSNKISFHGKLTDVLDMTDVLLLSSHNKLCLIDSLREYILTLSYLYLLMKCLISP